MATSRTNPLSAKNIEQIVLRIADLGNVDHQEAMNSVMDWLPSNLKKEWSTATPSEKKTRASGGPSINDLRLQAKQAGMTGFSKLKKAELVLRLEEMKVAEEEQVTQGSPRTSPLAKPYMTMDRLQQICKDRNIKGWRIAIDNDEDMVEGRDFTWREDAEGKKVKQTKKGFKKARLVEFINNYVPTDDSTDNEDEQELDEEEPPQEEEDSGDVAQDGSGDENSDEEEEPKPEPKKKKGKKKD